MVNPSIVLKCLSNVARLVPCSIVIAAIQMSWVGIGVPFTRNQWIISE